MDTFTRYHPDVNTGCQLSSHKFQDVKEAFEQIRDLQESRGLNGNSSTHREPNTSYRYRYTTPPRQETNRAPFYGFRQDRGGGGDFRASCKPNQHVHRGVNRGMNGFEFWSMQRQYRMMERTGLGLAVLLTCITLTVTGFGSEMIWRANNKGKSFDDLMRNLDSRAPIQERRRRRTNSEQIGTKRE